jgi:hypothetical protein
MWLKVTLFANGRKHGTEMQDQPQIPLVETSEVTIPDQLRGLFCEPAFLEGEDPNLYRSLLAAVIAERKPMTVSDWIAVNDLVTKLWEERILRRASNALIRGGTLEALQHFFAEVIKGEEGLKGMDDGAAHRAGRYFSDKAKERNEIRSLLAQYGITPAELHAKAAQQNSDALQMFERMIVARERGRRTLRKEDERRRRRQGRQEIETE